MRCEAGDTAMIVGGFKDNLGHFVHVERRHKSIIDGWIVTILGSCVAVQDGQFVLLHAGALCGIYDRNLRPLRDKPGHDETLYLAGMPFDQRYKHDDHSSR